MQTWTLDPTTGDYVMSGGSPVQTNGLATAAYIRVKTPKDGWMYAPNSKYGSRLREIKNTRRNNKDITMLENVVGVALQPMLDDGRAKSITAAVNNVAIGYFGLVGKIVQANGQTEDLNLPSIGV